MSQSQPPIGSDDNQQITSSFLNEFYVKKLDLESKPLITQEKLDHELAKYLTKESFNSDKLHELEKQQEKNQKIISWLVPAFVSVVGIIVSLIFN